MSSSENRSISSIFTSLLHHAQALVLLSGLLIYGLLFFAYDSFYSVVGLTPQDVGLSYLDILSHSTGTVLILGYLIVNVLVNITPTGGEIAAQQASPDDYKTKRAYPRMKVSVAIVSIVSIIVMYAGSYLAIRYFLVSVFAERRDELLRGEQIEPVRVFGLTLLDLRATPALLSREDKQEPITLPANALWSTLTDPRCVLYLGRSNDILVVYNPFRHETIRVPAQGVQITTGSKGLASMCRNDRRYIDPTIDGPKCSDVPECRNNVSPLLDSPSRPR